MRATRRLIRWVIGRPILETTQLEPCECGKNGDRSSRRAESWAT
jgi:hypothetical protein